MKNIFLLPTDKPSRLYLEDVKFKLTEYDYPNVDYAQNQHIYITNSEEIKEGDWCYDDFLKSVFQANSIMGVKTQNTSKKIILTTDQDLISDGVRAIDDEFLEWFVQNPSCEEVEVKRGFEDGTSYGYNFLDYKIIIPKEKLKQEIELIDGFIPTSFFDKQETLEEAAENYVWDSLFPIEEKSSFMNGAKWQTERSYSEEEVLELLNKREEYNKWFTSWLPINKWFEQFKKK